MIRERLGRAVAHHPRIRIGEDDGQPALELSELVLDLGRKCHERAEDPTEQSAFADSRTWTRLECRAQLALPADCWRS